MNDDTPITDVTDPKVDIRYTNGHVTGKVNFRFKQHIFNWIISVVVSSCGIHGVYLHFHEEDLEKQIKEQQVLLAESYKREAAVEEALKSAQLLLMQKSILTPMLSDQDKPRAK